MGSTWNMITTFIKYGPIDMLTEAVESGWYMEYSKWKKHLELVVTDKNLEIWKITCKVYKSLTLMEEEKEKMQLIRVESVSTYSSFHCKTM